MSVWPCLQVMSHGTQIHGACATHLHLILNLMCLPLSWSTWLLGVCVFFISPSFPLSPVSLWPRGRHPSRILSQLLSRSPQVSKFHTIMCISVHLKGATAIGLPPSVGPVYCESGAHRRLPQLVCWHLTALVSASWLNTLGALCRRAPWNAFRQPHLSACISRARRHCSGGYLHSMTTRRAPLTCSSAVHYLGDNLALPTLAAFTNTPIFPPSLLSQAVPATKQPPKAAAP